MGAHVGIGLHPTNSPEDFKDFWCKNITVMPSVALVVATPWAAPPVHSFCSCPQDVLKMRPLHLWCAEERREELPIETVSFTPEFTNMTIAGKST